MADPKKILIVEDDASFRERLARNLTKGGFHVVEAANGKAALDLLRERYVDLVLTDIKMPEMSGLELIEAIRDSSQTDVDHDLPIVVLSSLDDLETAVQAMRSGAADYLTKESSRIEIQMRLERVLKQSSLLNENRTLRDQISRRNQSDFGEIIGNSPAIAALKKEIGLIAPKAQRVLVTGETGVGKQLVARALHQLSAKRKGPFIDVNCGALPDENLFQSELFGHEQGAFTGATQQRRGRFEQAEGGTLFLDEIGELSANAQTKLLKVIESKTFSRLGGSKTIESDCQLVFATNRDLAQEVKDGNFREDLYYRINVLCLHIPPLRERLDDIPLLASSFLREFCREYNQEPLLLEPSAIKQLQGYGWPGNIRELRNVMERLTIRAQGGSITEEDVRQVGISGQAGGAGVPWQLPDEGIQLEEVERNLVEAALIKADWSQKEAASLLGISADRMNARVKKFGFRHPSWRRHKQ